MDAVGPLSLGATSLSFGTFLPVASLRGCVLHCRPGDVISVCSAKQEMKINNQRCFESLQIHFTELLRTVYLVIWCKTQQPVLPAGSVSGS